MSLSVETILLFAAGIVFLNLLIVLALTMKRVTRKEALEAFAEYRITLLGYLMGKKIDVGFKMPLSDYSQIKQLLQIDPMIQGNIEKLANLLRFEKKYIKRLNSLIILVRIEAAVYLGLIGTENARLALEGAIIQEKSFPVKLYMANSLADICHEDSLPVLTASLINSHRWYRDKVNMLISDFGSSFNSYLPKLTNRKEIEILELIVDFSTVYVSEEVKAFLTKMVDRKEYVLKKIEQRYGHYDTKCCANCIHQGYADHVNQRFCKFRGLVAADYKCRKYKILPVSINSWGNYIGLVYKAAGVLAHYYPKVLDDERYLTSKDIELKNIAIGALASFTSDENLTRLVSFLKEENTARSASYSISLILEKNPPFINILVQNFNDETDIEIKKKLAEILANRIEYFIMKLTAKSSKSVKKIIKEIILLGRTSETIDFLNKNTDLDLENELIAIIKEVLIAAPELADEFSGYLRERLALKCGLTLRQEIPVKKEEKKDRKLIITLYILLLVNMMIFPLVYCFRHYDLLFSLSVIEQVKIFVVEFNYYFVYYSLAINSIYILLLLMSSISAKQQLKLWKIKNNSLLFKKKMLPAISIIAPAFNEEKTIIESANSLLNLKYPEYDLIIVNDGSKDRTLQVLINYFGLKRVDYIFNYRLSTKHVRGIYLSRSLPKLIVVDKDNGGKADSLNVGINISKKEFFCGIDADSLLEEEALLKLASSTLDYGVETPAMGGNIFSINGCTVERGQIKQIHIPASPLARLQSIEYIRAFMAGRLGWALMNSLLIISGAFGLFKKERVVNVGGYLTSSGKYRKDTVGEDMELVVRICRQMRELGHKYRICYAFNANCWTEVPEDLKSLKKQRYRWHRGLIDILTFHKKMIFNPAYGRVGLVAMPYFFIFEMIGPIFEMQGYLMVAAALIFGLLNVKIALLLFVSTILMGVFISLASLFIAEKDHNYFQLNELLILVLYAVLENFGPRQIFSFWRVGAYLSMLKKPEGWGKPERKGFSASNNHGAQI